MDYQAVLDVVRNLPTEDQARLAAQIRDDLIVRSEDVDLTPELKEMLDKRLAEIDEDDQTEGFDPDLTPELKKELDRRIAEHKADPGSTVPWETVLAEALERHKQ